MNNIRRNTLIIIIIIVLAALLIVPKILSEKGKNQNLQGQNPQNQEIPADAYIVRTTDIENEISASGTIIANEEVEIRSELSRKVTGIYFNEGSFVGQGKLLFKLDDADLIARLNKLILDRDLNLKQEEREKQLYDKGLLTQDEYDIRSVTIQKIEADIEILEIEISRTSITAPFSGITGFRNVSLGSLVSPSVVLTTIQDIGKVKIDFSIPEKFKNSFSKGMDISFTVEGIEESFTGKVVTYDPNINESTRSIMIRAIAGNKARNLLPGSFVKVKIEAGNNPDAILIPSESLIPKLKGQSVFIYQNGKAVSRDVEIGFRSDKNIEITSGISIGDTLITTNILRLKPDSKIKLQNIN